MTNSQLSKPEARTTKLLRVGEIDNNNRLGKCGAFQRGPDYYGTVFSLLLKEEIINR